MVRISSSFISTHHTVAYFLPVKRTRPSKKVPVFSELINSAVKAVGFKKVQFLGIYNSNDNKHTHNIHFNQARWHLKPSTLWIINAHNEPHMIYIPSFCAIGCVCVCLHIAVREQMKTTRHCDCFFLPSYTLQGGIELLCSWRELFPLWCLSTTGSAVTVTRQSRRNVSVLLTPSLLTEEGQTRARWKS